MGTIVQDNIQSHDGQSAQQNLNNTIQLKIMHNLQQKQTSILNYYEQARPQKQVKGEKREKHESIEKTETDSQHFSRETLFHHSQFISEKSRSIINKVCFQPELSTNFKSINNSNSRNTSISLLTSHSMRSKHHKLIRGVESMLPVKFQKLVTYLKNIDQVLLMKYIQKQQTIVPFKDVQVVTLLNYSHKVELKVVKQLLFVNPGFYIVREKSDKELLLSLPESFQSREGNQLISFNSLLEERKQHIVGILSAYAKLIENNNSENPNVFNKSIPHNFNLPLEEADKQRLMQRNFKFFKVKLTPKKQAKIEAKAGRISHPFPQSASSDSVQKALLILENYYNERGVQSIFLKNVQKELQTKLEECCETEVSDLILSLVSENPHRMEIKSIKGQQVMIMNRE